jgi:hypothetical protein
MSLGGLPAISRRSFVGQTLATGVFAAIVQARGYLDGKGWLPTLDAATPGLLRDTINGLLAFVVPGPDPHSVQQGLTTVEPGGVDAGVVDAVIATLDGTTPFLPGFSSIVAATLNAIAQAINPASASTPGSPFAHLSYPEKAAVFQIMDATDALKPLAAILPAFVAYFVFSSPLGWQLSNYSGIADGRAEFLGYFENRAVVR